MYVLPQNKYIFVQNLCHKNKIIVMDDTATVISWALASFGSRG